MTTTEERQQIEMSGQQEGRKVTFERALLSSDSSEDDLAPGQNTPGDQGSLPSYRRTRQHGVYRWRWLLLGALCLLNISNGMVTAASSQPSSAAGSY